MIMLAVIDFLILIGAVLIISPYIKIEDVIDILVFGLFYSFVTLALFYSFKSLLIFHVFLVGKMPPSILIELLILPLDMFLFFLILLSKKEIVYYIFLPMLFAELIIFTIFCNLAAGTVLITIVAILILVSLRYPQVRKIKNLIKLKHNALYLVMGVANIIAGSLIIYGIIP